MTEATEKQINYAKKLGIENANQYSKEVLREMIDIRAPKNKEEFKPEDVTDEYAKPAEKASEGKYHLSPEQVRTNALEAVQRHSPSVIPSVQVELAKEFEEYLFGKS